MVKFSTQSLDRVFFALSDSTRRDMLGCMAKGPIAVTALASRYEISLPAVVKHLGILESCGLIGTDKVGRVRRCELRSEPLKLAFDWIKDYREFWDAQLDSLGEYLDTLEDDDR